MRLQLRPVVVAEERSLGAREVPSVRRLFWALVMLLSLGLCSQQIYNMWHKWTLFWALVMLLSLGLCSQQIYNMWHKWTLFWALVMLLSLGLCSQQIYNMWLKWTLFWALVMLLSLGLCSQQIYNMWLKWTLFWALVMLLSLGLCSQQIYNMWHKWTLFWALVMLLSLGLCSQQIYNMWLKWTLFWALVMLLSLGLCSQQIYNMWLKWTLFWALVMLLSLGLCSQQIYNMWLKWTLFWALVMLLSLGLCSQQIYNMWLKWTLFWALVMLLSLGLCSQQIYNMWLKWTYAPVIVSFDERSTPVWEIPFPAVTICSETKARQRSFNFTHAIYNKGNLTGEQLKTLGDVSLLCDYAFAEGNDTTDEEAVEFFREAAPMFEETVMFVVWRNGDSNLTGDFFKPSLTEEGLCYTFNMLSPAELFTADTVQRGYDFMQHDYEASGWSLESGYDPGAPLETYPRRALGAGYEAGFVVLLRSYSQDIDYLCKGAVQGFKVLLHNPAELPRVSQQYLRSDLNQELVVAIRPSMMTTSPSLKSYIPRDRKCFFQHERRLRFFRVYTQGNCQQECLANFTLGFCGCVGFHMPRSADMPLCGPGKKTCMLNASDELILREVERELEGQRRGKAASCDCLPSCTAVAYDGETSTAFFSWEDLVRGYLINTSEEEWHGANIGRVVMFFKTPQFIPSRRAEVYGNADFIANCGGLLGLFLGFSVISVVEIFYYLTIRPCLNVNLKKVFCTNKGNTIALRDMNAGLESLDAIF
ncbi:pickpocket protein 28-like [Bacillus rossius redtenbacheri]|uniref:pickpocket protein 28-like n=1 Tax=Bacillus rossius redtenbacheri TaxID=93214 RepID=UPI002FDEA36F